MYRTLMVSVAALALVLPALLSTSAKAGDVSTLEASAVPAAVSTTETTGEAKETPELEAMTRKIPHGPHVRRPMPQSSHASTPKPSQVRSFTDAGTKIKKGNHPSVQDQVKTLQQAQLQAPAEPKKIRALGKAKIAAADPFAGQTNAQLQAQIDAARQAKQTAAAAKAQGKSQAIQTALQVQAKEAEAKAFEAQDELKRRRDEAKKTAGDPRPGQGGGGDDRPGKFGDRGGDDRPGPSFGDRGDRSGPDFAPGYTPQPGYVQPPRYTAQPSVRPRDVSDDPVCLRGTWALQDGQKKYVCLSWHFRGQIYTPDQLEGVLAQLGKPRPALLGG